MVRGWRGIPVIALLVSLVSGDIPVHCLRHQLEGEWLFELGALVHDKSSIKCSDAPQQYQSKMHNFGLGKRNFKTHSTMTVLLESPDVVHVHDKDGTHHKGHWTPVYDEGFHVQVKGHSFFAYSKFIQHDDHDESHCGETYPGWVHPTELVDTSKWGCYVATKKTNIPPPQKFRKFGSHPLWRSSLLLATEPGVKEDRAVELINNHPLSTWTARRYAHHERPHRLALGNPIRHYKQFKRPEGLVQEQVDITDIPQNWDWTNVNGQSFLDEVINQNACGSCFAVATADMISARSRIQSRNAKRDKYRASPQSVLSQCGFYAQGCQGGFPFLAAKYAKDFGSTSWNKVKYTAADNQGRCPKPDEIVSRVEKFEYVGGHYGACTEEGMIRSLFDRGPLVVAIEVAPTMSMYSSGIFDTNVVLPDQDHYQRVNHALLLVGFGVENGQKFWKIKNSWGKYWGDNGYFKVARGKNCMNVEHMAVHAEPVLTDALPVKRKSLTLTEEKSFGHAVLAELGQTQPSQQAPQAPQEEAEGKSSGADGQIMDPAFVRAAERAGNVLLDENGLVLEDERHFVEDHAVRQI